jgi:hypothetical protein
VSAEFRRTPPADRRHSCRRAIARKLDLRGRGLSSVFPFPPITPPVCLGGRSLHRSRPHRLPQAGEDAIAASVTEKKPLPSSDHRPAKTQLCVATHNWPPLIFNSHPPSCPRSPYSPRAPRAQRSEAAAATAAGRITSSPARAAVGGEGGRRRRRSGGGWRADGGRRAETAEWRRILLRVNQAVSCGLSVGMWARAGATAGFVTRKGFQDSRD